MGEIIAALDGYFCFPGHNFDWKYAGVPRTIPQHGGPHSSEAKEFGKNLRTIPSGDRTAQFVIFPAG
jgi:hypothetical protein